MALMDDREPSGWDMFGNVAMMLGPALMAKGFNMPALAMMGPQLMQMQQRSRERSRDRRQQQAMMEGLFGTGGTTGGMAEGLDPDIARLARAQMTAGDTEGALKTMISARQEAAKAGRLEGGGFGDLVSYVTEMRPAIEAGEATPTQQARYNAAMAKLNQARMMATPEGSYMIPGITEAQIFGGAPGAAPGAPGMAGAQYIPKAPTEAQSKAEDFANRMQEAHVSIMGLEDLGADEWGIVTGRLPNIFKSSQRQLFDQSQRNFINAILRRESGAAISESEFDNARQQYFPQPGDGPEVIAQKRRNREVAIQGVIGAAKPGTELRQPPPAATPAPPPASATAAPTPMTATNPTTGERLRYDPATGQWVPM